MANKILIDLKEDEKYVWKGKGDFHTKDGFIKEADIIEGKNPLITSKGAQFLCFEAQHYDRAQAIRRGPQIIIPKDLGYICSRSGLTRNSVVLEAGGGSGGATLFFAQLVKEVTTYEIRADHCEIIEKNLKPYELTNLTLINKDLAEDVANLEKNKYDLLLLDMPEPAKVLEKDLSCLKSGAFIICYIPSITQIQTITNYCEANETKLYIDEITEVGLRHWKVSGQIARPEHRKINDHTAFLVILRKL
jgi:tRNA (adenine57-N1/adenine58-N1)-methyltransferase